jgi:hypothetical protein
MIAPGSQCSPRHGFSCRTRYRRRKQLQELIGDLSEIVSMDQLIRKATDSVRSISTIVYDGEVLEQAGPLSEESNPKDTLASSAQVWIDQRMLSHARQVNGNTKLTLDNFMQKIVRGHLDVTRQGIQTLHTGVFNAWEQECGVLAPGITSESLSSGTKNRPFASDSARLRDGPGPVLTVFRHICTSAWLSPNSLSSHSQVPSVDASSTIISSMRSLLASRNTEAIASRRNGSLLNVGMMIDK